MEEICECVCRRDGKDQGGSKVEGVKGMPRTIVGRALRKVTVERFGLNRRGVPVDEATATAKADSRASNFMCVQCGCLKTDGIGKARSEVAGYAGEFGSHLRSVVASPVLASPVPHSHGDPIRVGTENSASKKKQLMVPTADKTNRVSVGKENSRDRRSVNICKTNLDPDSVVGVASKKMSRARGYASSWFADLKQAGAVKEAGEEGAKQAKLDAAKARETVAD